MEDRPDSDVLTNAPVTMMVGGAGKEPPKEIELRAPALGAFKRQMKLVSEAIYFLIRDNREFMNGALAGGDVGEVNFDISSCADSFEIIACRSRFTTPIAWEKRFARRCRWRTSCSIASTE